MFGIPAVRVSKSAPQSIFIARQDNQVNVVRHQAIAPDFAARLARGFAQQVLVKLVVAIFKEGLAAPVAPLGHMMRTSGNNNARKACRGEQNTNLVHLVNCHRNSVIPNSVILVNCHRNSSP